MAVAAHDGPRAADAATFPDSAASGTKRMRDSVR